MSPITPDVSRLITQLAAIEKSCDALEEAARACRAAQKAYFKDRTNGNLSAAKKAEAELDKLLA